MSASDTRIFVYGSLRVGFHNPAYSYITRYFHFAGEAIVKGKFYFNGVVPVAVPTEDEEYITGDLYELNDPADLDWALIQLDDYEGLNVEEGEIPLYRRVPVTALHNVQPMTAWIYWFNRDTTGMASLDADQVSKYLQDQLKS